MNWKELFDEDRLDRGFQYYIENRVYNVIITEDSITSKVEGSRSNVYDVKINFNKNNIDSLYCTCPYSYADFNCKHMVATLYKLEEIRNNKISTIFKNYDDETLFRELIDTVDETQLRRFIYDKFKEDNQFKEEFINKFQEEFTPEDFDNYENMLENIFDIDVVELYNENGFFQEAPFQKYLENFLNDKIRILYKNQEYSYVLQLLYIIYENISEKTNVIQYIQIDDILKECNYYMEKLIDVQDSIENEEIFNYLINKIHYDYNSKTTSYLIQLCLNKFNSKVHLKQLDLTIDEIIDEHKLIPEDILLTKYELMKLLDYTLSDQKSFLEDNKSEEKIMKILINSEIDNKNFEKAIEYLNQNKDIHGKTYSLENTLLLLSLYQSINDKENAINELKTIIYDFNVKDMYFINQLKELSDEKQWNSEKKDLIKYYKENYSFDFLNEIYVEEKDFENLYLNIINNCQITALEKYREYYEEKYNDDILKKYKEIILNEAKTSKTVSGYSVILNYMDIMMTYKNSSEVVNSLISILRNKYKERKLFMKKLEEFEIINSLK